MLNMLFWGLIGYCVAVLFPVPWLSQLIINKWANVPTIVKDLITKYITSKFSK